MKFPSKEQQNKNFRNVFYWTLDKDELENQVANYSTLGWGKSYRKQVVGIMIFFLAMSLLLSLTGLYASLSDFLLSLIIYVPVLIFIYKGHPWAIITLMILWTLEKGYQLISGEPASAAAVLFFWY